MVFKRMISCQKGFTLIEIIAVFIIVGILAVVAVPKYFSMKEDATQAALSSAITEAVGMFNQAFSRYILDWAVAPYNVANSLKDQIVSGVSYNYLGTDPSLSGAQIGDFIVRWEKQPDGNLKIAVLDMKTIGSGTFAAIPASDKEKIVTGITWRSAQGGLP